MEKRRNITDTTMTLSMGYLAVTVLVVCHLESSLEETSTTAVGIVIATTTSNVATVTNETSLVNNNMLLNENDNDISENRTRTTGKEHPMNTSYVDDPDSGFGRGNITCWNSSLVTEVPSNDTGVICNNNASNNTTANIMEPEVEVKATAKSDYVDYVVVPTFYLQAVLGNGLTIRVMISRRFRGRTSSIILIALAISDTIFSCIVPFNKKLIRNLLGYDIRALSSLGCSIFFIIHKTSKMSSSWFVAFISFERFMAICFPLKTKFICTKRNTLIGITCVYVGLLIFNGIWDFSTKIVNGVCIPYYNEPETATLAKVYLVVGTFVYCLIPAAVMLVLTPVTVVQLVRHSATRKALAKKDIKSDETARITAMLIGVSVSYLVLVMPIGICHNVSFALGESIFETTHIGMVIARETLQTMEQLNYSINFLLYVMCSRDFRNKVVQILRLKALTLRKSSASSTKQRQGTPPGTAWYVDPGGNGTVLRSDLRVTTS